jgi:hypothetical protein
MRLCFASPVIQAKLDACDSGQICPRLHATHQACPEFVSNLEAFESLETRKRAMGLDIEMWVARGNEKALDDLYFHVMATGWPVRDWYQTDESNIPELSSACVEFEVYEDNLAFVSKYLCDPVWCARRGIVAHCSGPLYDAEDKEDPAAHVGCCCIECRNEDNCARCALIERDERRHMVEWKATRLLRAWQQCTPTWKQIPVKARQRMTDVDLFLARAKVRVRQHRDLLPQLPPKTFTTLKRPTPSRTKTNS